MSYSKGITELYQSFDYDTKHELWDNKEDVRKIVKKDKEVLEKYARGELGVNVLFKHRAIVALELIKDIHDAAFSTALELLKERAPGEFQESKEFLEELKTFSYLRKTNVFDYEQKFNRIFSYDFEKLIGSNFKEYPIKLKNPINVQFFADEKQKIMIKETIEEYGSDVNGIGKILSKMLGNMLQRKVKFESRTMKENILENMEISTSPGEFV